MIVALFCSDIVKFGRREIGKIVHCLPDKKYSPGYPGLTTARIAPKIWQGQPQTMYSREFQISSNSVHFGRRSERVNTVRVRSKVNPIFG